jgi:hypothetical protein
MAGCRSSGAAELPELRGGGGGSWSSGTAAAGVPRLSEEEKQLKKKVGASLPTRG